MLIGAATTIWNHREDRHGAITDRFSELLSERPWFAETVPDVRYFIQPYQAQPSTLAIPQNPKRQRTLYFRGRNILQNSLHQRTCLSTVSSLAA